MDLSTLRDINQIIERDSKDTTYKFALLRGVIDTIQEYSHFTRKKGERICLPTGILVFFWLRYYYPLIDSEKFIPQKNGETEISNKLVFRTIFKDVTRYYKDRGGISVFINDLKRGRIELAIEQEVLKLIKTLTETIYKQPMRYIGWSITNEHYGIFVKESGSNSQLKASLYSMTMNCGTYSIPSSYYEVLEYFGAFISGRNSILMEWANFTVNRPGYALNREFVLNELLNDPIDKRDTRVIESIFREKMMKTKLLCIWSERLIQRDSMNIDHILPFAVWRSNDLWNLIPTHETVNGNKKDKIPSANFIEKRSEALKNCWLDVYEKIPEAFQRDIELGLLGRTSNDIDQLLNESIVSLKEKCDFLIEKRGMPAWEI
jgi:hypothetical protein